MSVDAPSLKRALADALQAASDLKAARQTGASEPQRAVDEQHPWLGLDSFSEETRAYFFGREQEVGDLARRVQRKLLTTLFGQSGLGKTSILRAGIVPRLRPNGYCPIYVRLDYSGDSPSPAEQIKAAIFRATREHGQWTQAGVSVEGESLWEFLHHRNDFLKDAQGATVVPLLIFDQFEEIFTLAQADDEGKRRAAKFLEDLADLVENRPPKELEARIDTDESLAERFDFARADYRILISLREDYLAHLEGMKATMPSITQNRMRLARMTGEQALAAVVKPGGRLVSEEVAEAIVRFIAGGSELPNAEVEPSLLSLICRELNNARVAQGRSEISVDLLAGSKETILSEFYERALSGQPVAVRRFIEDEMLTDSGYRESLAEERVRKAFNAAGAAPEALARLVDRRVLRVEDRLDLRRVELTHDVLCKVVAESRDLRHAREAQEEAERQLAAQKERELTARKALRRARAIAGVCAFLALGAVASAVFGYYGMQRARETRELAQAARGEAEKLVGFLLDDYFRELRPLGQLDLVGNLARRAIKYYKDLPPELNTPDTERNRALAQTRLASVLRVQGRPDEAQPLVTDALQVLERLRREGDASEQTVVGLALARHAQGAMLSQRARYGEGIRAFSEGLELLQPLADRAQASRAVLELQALLLTARGFSRLRGSTDGDRVDLERSLDTYRRMGGIGTEPDVSTGYAQSAAWLAESHDRQGDRAKARELASETYRISRAVAELRPLNRTARTLKAQSLSQLGGLEYSDLRIAEAYKAHSEAEREWGDMARSDPTNSASANNLAVARTDAADALWRLGRMSEALKKMDEALAVEKQARMTGFLASNLAWWHSWRAVLSGNMGDAQAAHSHVARARAMFDLRIKESPASVDAAIQGLWLDERSAQSALALGNESAALKTVQDALRRAEALAPEGEAQRALIVRARTFLHRTAGRIHLNGGNDAEAVRHFRASAAAREGDRGIPPVFEPFTYLEAGFGHAQALARLGRLEEARAMQAATMVRARELRKRGPDDVFTQAFLAQGLLVSAVLDRSNRRGHLREAAALLDQLPPDAKRWALFVRIRRDASEELAKGS